MGGVKLGMLDNMGQAAPDPQMLGLLNLLQQQGMSQPMLEAVMRQFAANMPSRAQRVPTNTFGVRG